MKTVLTVLLLSCACLAQPLAIDKSRARPLERWKTLISAYSQRHYGEKTWELQPKCIVLHYTAGDTFPWNLVRSEEFDGEAPGLASHYVVDGAKVWEIIPPTVRSRGAYGINHRGINIEMVARDASDLANRTQTMNTSSQLVLQLMQRFGIPLKEIYSHQTVSKMDTSLCPWVLDRVHPESYNKIDPGEQNLRYILERVKQGDL